MKKQILILLFLFCFLILACSRVPSSDSYQELYQHSQGVCCKNEKVIKTDYFLVILVDARHLDYTDNQSFLKTLAKHPTDGSKTGDVGHSWIYLEGWQNGQRVYLEGGHSGDSGEVQATYFDGIMNYIDFGFANPSNEERQNPRFEPNPVKYLWETQKNGFFQSGRGKHWPTFAAKIDLSIEQFNQIFLFIKNYRYENYALVGNQCSSFVMQVAGLAGLDLECEVTIKITPSITVGDKTLHLWADESYEHLTIASPDILEKALVEAVVQDKAENAIGWYHRTHPRSVEEHINRMVETVMYFPNRYSRYLRFK